LVGCGIPADLERRVLSKEKNYEAYFQKLLQLSARINEILEDAIMKTLKTVGIDDDRYMNSFLNYIQEPDGVELLQKQSMNLQKLKLSSAFILHLGHWFHLVSRSISRHSSSPWSTSHRYSGTVLPELWPTSSMSSS
jgi:hypothetical protein